MQTIQPDEPGGAPIPVSGAPGVAGEWATSPAPSAPNRPEPHLVDRAASSVAPANQLGGGASAPTLLIVDDSRTIRHLYTFVLKAAGYTVLAAADGVEGLEMALSTPPDLLVVDMLMPRMDGLEMLRALRISEREHGRTPAPALLLTALLTPPEVEPGLGVLAVLDKGHLTPTDVAESIRVYFAARAHA